MKKPLVSIIMPTLNSAAFIRESIHSLIDQKYDRLELIVVDGGSTDGTLEIVESYCGDGDLTLIRLTRQTGSMPQSLNAGLAAAKGEFMARFDADDVAYEWRLHDQVNFLISNPDVDLVGTGADIFGDRESVARSPLSHTAIRDMYLVNNPFFHPTIMFRRKLYDSGLFYYDENQVCEEDYELWGRVIPHAKCANLDQSSIRYRVHGQNAQFDPRKPKLKEYALREFLETFSFSDSQLISALAEFQCSGFIRYTDYVVFSNYAKNCARKGLPKLGWIHDSLLRCKTFREFQAWYIHAKGWNFAASM
jgi:glycosyltransferase involved in cell wall biosynthesis